jgi:DNA-binding transcriptional ArsR family regulator
MAVPHVVEKQPATPAELKAMAHPLRWRILRLCLDEALTNKTLAGRLGKDPATVLHHVRTLLDTGFLVAEPVRSGSRGALEKPYRATGKTWTLSIEHFPPDERFVEEVAAVDAFRDEFVQAGPGASQEMARLGLRLDARALEELRQRLDDVVQDFARRPVDPSGDPYGLFIAVHRQA